MPMRTEGLAPDLLERVLSRLGLSAAPSPDLDGLKTVYAAWCRWVPFDNIRKLIHVQTHAQGVLPGDSAQDFFEAWLKYKTGGTCWAGNGALHSLLVTLGFDAQRGVATMLVAPSVPPNHGTVSVELDNVRYVTDASILHSEPLPLEDEQASTIEHPAWGVRCVQQNNRWHIRFRPMHIPTGLECRIEQFSTTREDFHERHERTRPWSPFNYELHARLIHGDSIVGIAFGQRVAYDGTGAVSQSRLAGDERQRVLIDELGINEEIVQRLPPDTPTPPPPWSRTAQAASSRGVA
jgi:N-hydroxyarylamine O-acetyltransferase